MKIGDLCTYAPKSSIKAGEAVSNGEYMFFTSSSDENKRYSDYQLDCEAIIMGTGGNATLHYYNGKFSTSTDCVVLIPNESIRCKYLYYFFLCNMVTLENGFKGAGLKHTNKNYISNIEIYNVPDIETQDKIIKILDVVCGIKLYYRQQLQKLDELVKSRFIEMFGSISDDKKVSMSDVCLIITDGTHQPPKFTSWGIPFLFVSNIVGNEITYDAEKYISEETYAQLIKRTPIEIGDVLLSTVGSYGHPAVVKSNKPFCFQRHIAYLKPKTQLIDSCYLHGAILSLDVQKQIEERVKGIAQKTLNLSEIRKLRLPLPTLVDQKQFAAFVEQVDKLKFATQQALDKSQLLFDSLMQKYFG